MFRLFFSRNKLSSPALIYLCLDSSEPVTGQIISELSKHFGYANIANPEDLGLGKVLIVYTNPFHERKSLISKTLFELLPALSYAYVVEGERVIDYVESSFFS